MRLVTCLLAAASVITSALAFDIPDGASVSQPWKHTGRPYFGWNQKDKWGNKIEDDRRKITIRASEDDTDDISADFVWALEQAQNGGLVHLEEGKTYIIGKKIDLPVLNDVYIKLDGTLKVSREMHFSKILSDTIDVVHRRCRVLAKQLLLLSLPKEHYLHGLER